MTDADLDAVVPGAPDAVLFPKAEGGATVTHLDAKLTAREAIAGLPEGSIKILAQSVETAAGVFTAGTYRDCSARLIGLTWGPEDLSAELGAEANREADGDADRALSAGAHHVPVRRGGGARAGLSRPSMSISATPRCCAPTPRSRAATALPAARDPSGAGAGDQRRCSRRRRSRSTRPRRWWRLSPPIPAPARSASTARCTTARILRARRRCWRASAAFKKARLLGRLERRRGLRLGLAVLRLLHALALLDEGARRIGAEQFVRLGLVGGDRASWRYRYSHSACGSLLMRR